MRPRASPTPGQPLRCGSDGGRRRVLVAAPFDQGLGDLGEEPRLRLALRPAPPGPRQRPGEVQTPLGAGDPDVGQPFFFDFLVVANRALVRKGVLLQAGEEHHGKLQALGGVKGHRGDHAAVVLSLGDLVGVRDDGYLLEEVREGTLGRGTLAGLGVTPPGSAAGGVELPRHGDQLVGHHRVRGRRDVLRGAVVCPRGTGFLGQRRRIADVEAVTTIWNPKTQGYPWERNELPCP